MLIAALFLSPATVLAADTAALFGVITDSTGAVIHNATVSAKDQLTGLVVTTTSDENGGYRFPALPVGRYVVTVHAPNFKTAVSTEAVLQVDQQVRLDVALQVGQTSETVSVSSQSALVNTADATVSAVIDSQRITDLPLNGRDVLSLTTLAPGVRLANSTVYNHPLEPQGNVPVSASGTGGNSIDYSLDGGDWNYNYNHTANVYPNPDFIQEFTFETNNLDPQYGRRGGGGVNAVTKSGTNAFHGTLFEYVRNELFNANNYFASTNDGLKRNQYGGTIGGPVRIPHLFNGTNKTFFFFGYQGTRLRQTPTTSVATVFTAAEKGGDFSKAVDGNGNPITITDPNTGAPFPGNVIPPQRLDPAAQNFVNHYIPSSTDPAGLLFYNTRIIQNDGQWVGRLDEHVSDKDLLFFRAFRDNYTAPSEGDPSNVLSASFDSFSQYATGLMVNWSHTLSSHLLTENSFSFDRHNGQYFPYANTPSNSDLGVQITRQANDRTMNISVGPDFSVYAGGTVSLISENFNYRNTTTLIRRNQEIRFGADIVRSHFDIPRSSYLGDGWFSFGNAFSGNYLSDFLLGLPSNFQQSQGYLEHERETDWGFWGADRIKVTPRLTVNLGLRYQPFLPYYDLSNQNARFTPGEQSQIYTKLPVGAAVYGDPGVPRRITDSSFNRFSPRIGVAFDPAGNGKISLRAGYGIFYGSIPMEYNGEIGTYTPFSLSESLTNPGSFVNPYQGNDPYVNVGYPPPHNFVFPNQFNFGGTAPRFRENVIQQWNVTAETQLFGPSMLVSVSYQGTHGTHLERESDLNPAVYIPGASSEANEQARKPYPDFATIYEFQSNSYVDYSALVITFERRFTKGVSVLASYMRSKAIDDELIGADSNILGLSWISNTNPFNYKLDRGVSDTNVPNRFVASYLWKLPAVASSLRPLRFILDGWQHNGIVTLQSGTPFSIMSGLDNSLSGVYQDRADLVGNPHAPRPAGATRLTEYFNTAAFGPNAIGTFGNSPRNLLYGPGTENVDMSLFKTFPVKETWNIEFRAEVFNVFNHPNFGNPVNNLSSSQFGSILSAGSPRIIQLALRLTF